jgi:hypothetical protein
VILDCDRLWTGLVSAVYRLRRQPRVTNDPPPVERAAAPAAPDRTRAAEPSTIPPSDGPP